MPNVTLETDDCLVTDKGVTANPSGDDEECSGERYVAAPSGALTLAECTINGNTGTEGIGGAVSSGVIAVAGRRRRKRVALRILLLLS